MTKKLELDWASIDPKLGVINDCIIAKEYGVSEISIARRRKLLGIPACKTHSKRFNWEPHIPLLGQMDDEVVSKLLGISRSAVTLKRNSLGIPPFVPPPKPPIDWDAIAHLFGKIPDVKIGKDYNIPHLEVGKERHRRGIAKFGDLGIDWNEVAKRMGNEPDLKLAREYGCHESTIRSRRRKLGIPDFKFTYVTEEGEQAANFQEALIDIWLHANNIPHKLHAPIAGSNFKSDWTIHDGKTVVEYAGLAVSKTYGETYRYNLSRKIKFYKASGLRVLVIYPKDLHKYDLGIMPKFTGHVVTHGIDMNNQPWLTMSDRQIALSLGIGQTDVSIARRKLGIPVFRPGNQDWSTVDWNQTNLQIANKFGNLSEKTVARERERLGIAPNKRGPHFKWENAGLGTDTDVNIGIKWNVDPHTVFMNRKRLGIPAFASTRRQAKVPQ